MSINPKQAKRIRDLLAHAVEGTPNALDMLRRYMTEEGLHVDDLGIGTVRGSSDVGDVGDVGGSGDVGDAGISDEPEAVAPQGEDYIHEWLRRAGVRCAYDHTLSWGRNAIDSNDPLSRVGRQPLTLRKVVRSLSVEAASDKVKLPVRLINAVLANWMDDQRKAYAQDVFAKIDMVVRRPSPAEESAGRTALERLCELRLAEDPRYAAALILTIIHQIKRKLMGLRVDHHLVLTVYSQGGGSGKSKLCEALLSALQALAASTSLEDLLDGRSAGIWAMYAIYLDDVDETAAKSKGQFRRRISQEKWVSRVLGTGNFEAVGNNATMIMSTHHRIYEIMPDTFSMRRFGELHARETAPDVEAIEAVDNADWHAIWQSVDPEGPRPIDKLGFGATLRARQEDARVKGPVEQWMTQITEDDPGFARHVAPTGWIRGGDLFEHCYKPYADLFLGADGRLSLSKFGRDLKKLIAALGVRSPLEVREGRSTTEYRVRNVSPDQPTAPTPPTTPTPDLGPSRPGATHH